MTSPKSSPRVGGSLEAGTDTLYWRTGWRASPSGNVAVPVKRIAAALIAAALVSCSQAQMDTAVATQATIQAGLDTACASVAAAEAVANAAGVSMIPQAQTIEGFIGGSCIAGRATAALITKGLTDPATQAWTANLGTDLRMLVPPKS